MTLAESSPPELLELRRGRETCRGSLAPKIPHCVLTSASVDFSQLTFLPALTLSSVAEHTAPRQAIAKMPPKKVYIQSAGSRRQPKGFFASTYDSLTSPENSSMVKAIASFAVSSMPSAPAVLPVDISSSRKTNFPLRSALLSLRARGASSCFLRKL